MINGTTLFILIFGGIIFVATIISVISFKKNVNNIKCQIEDVQVGNLYVTNIRNNLNKYYEYISNPFNKVKIYPEFTVIVRDIKTNENGQKWIAYQYVKSELETPAENTKFLSYAEINEFLHNRVKVDKCY